MQEEIYGPIDRASLKNKGKYAEFKFSE